MIDTARAFAPAMYNATTDAPPVTGPAQPSAPRAALPTNSKAMGRDEFLKMLVAQLKNQDPLNPMDGKEMAAQLAQFSTVEQLVSINKSLEAQSASAAEMQKALEALEQTQNERADELAQLIEGQMAMGMVGKTGIAAGDTTFVDAAGKGTIMVDTGSLAGTGRITITDEKGKAVSSATVPQVRPGQQSFELGDFAWEPPLPAGRYKYKFEVATDGDRFQTVKTYTAGRITGMKYDNGNPILLIGDSLQLPMAQLIQLRS